jgi:hypothetical protein
LKLGYYYPNEINESFKDHLIKPDSYYDAVETEYRQLCDKYQIPATAADMVSFDLERPCCRFIKSIYSNPKMPNWTPIEL